MITITQPKIAGLSPRWAPFPGFSLLFDAPAVVYRMENGIEVLACDMDREATPEFYRRAYRGLARLGTDRMLQTYGFCPLPPASYHVTAFDVANVGDLDRCRAELRDGLKATLHTLPSPEAFAADLLRSERDVSLSTEPLSFRFGALCHWTSVMVVRLEPTDEARYQAFVAKRAALSGEYRERFGVGASASFTPHLSLGYFMNQEAGELARARMAEWNATMEQEIGDAVVTFPSASLHGFTDMATFFRVA